MRINVSLAQIPVMNPRQKAGDVNCVAETAVIVAPSAMSPTNHPERCCKGN